MSVPVTYWQGMPFARVKCSGCDGDFLVPYHPASDPPHGAHTCPACKGLKETEAA